jgi:hypothetical protein
VMLGGGSRVTAARSHAHASTTAMGKATEVRPIARVYTAPHRTMGSEPGNFLRPPLRSFQVTGCSMK